MKLQICAESWEHTALLTKIYDAVMSAV